MDEGPRECGLGEWDAEALAVFGERGVGRLIDGGADEIGVDDSAGELTEASPAGLDFAGGGTALLETTHPDRAERILVGDRAGLYAGVSP